MENKIIGPVLPENFLIATANEEAKQSSLTSELYGPQLPQHLLNVENIENAEKGSDSDNTDTDDVFGPLPPHLEVSSWSQKALNDRAEILRHESRYKIINETDETAKRERWMTELPPESSLLFATGSRKFKSNTNEKKLGRSLWTDTPNSKRNQETVNESNFFEKSAIEKRNEVMDEIVKRSKKHKKEKKTLLELHQEKLKKKKKQDKEKEQHERRQFDRDVDLRVNRFDEGQKRSIISKAQLLDTRFKAGHSKYL